MSGEIVLPVFFGRKSKKINYTTEKQRHFVFGNQCITDWIEKSISFGSSHFVPLQHEQKHEKSNSYCWAIAIWHSDHTHFSMVRCKISPEKNENKTKLDDIENTNKGFLSREDYILEKAFSLTRDAVGLIHYHTLHENLRVDHPDGSHTVTVIPCPET